MLVSKTIASVPNYFALMLDPDTVSLIVRPPKAQDVGMAR